MKIESEVKSINYPQQNVYNKIADLNNLSSIKEKFNDPVVREKLKEQVPEDKMAQIQNTLETMKFDTDSVSVNVSPIGDISISIIERTPEKCIKFTSTNSPVSFYLWVQILPLTETTSKMKITVDANVPIFLAGMIKKPLTEGVGKLADILAMLPYE